MKRNSAYFHGNRGNSAIALTFDDGPFSDTLELLEVLKKHDAKVTFFLVGKMIDGRESIVQSIKALGHEIGNHTFSHKRLWFKSKRFIEEDIKKCDKELQRLGVKTNLIRFPGFKCDRNALSVCEKLGKKIIFAEFFSSSQFAYDWFRPWLRKWHIPVEINIDDLVKRTVSGTQNGSILGFHDYLQEIGPHPEIVPIMENLIPKLKEKGFKFATVSEII